MVLSWSLLPSLAPDKFGQIGVLGIKFKLGLLEPRLVLFWREGSQAGLSSGVVAFFLLKALFLGGGDVVGLGLVLGLGLGASLSGQISSSFCGSCTTASGGIEHVAIRRHSRRCHGTDDDFEPLFSGVSTIGKPLQCRQEKHRSGGRPGNGPAAVSRVAMLPTPDYDQISGGQPG
jgi:hypothetical protein